MSHIRQLDHFLKTLELSPDKKTEFDQLIRNLEEEFNRLSFLSKKYKRDQQIHENFVHKTVELLEKSNTELRSSNAQLTKSNEALKKSNEELERFAFIASHDLKTPLHNIILFSELLKRKLEHHDDPIVQDCLSFIEDGGKRMNNLIVDVLEYSKLSKYDKDKALGHIDLNELVVEVTDSISAYIETRGASVEVFNQLPALKWNRSKLYLLFKNLIENGLKYNQSNTPKVDVHCLKDDLNYTFVFKDNGIGIEEKYISKIFQMFYRLHNQQDYEGTGLGLSTCKKIVEEMNGSISVDSQVGIGTSFFVKLPIQFRG